MFLPSAAALSFSHPSTGCGTVQCSAVWSKIWSFTTAATAIKHHILGPDCSLNIAQYWLGGGCYKYVRGLGLAEVGKILTNRLLLIILKDLYSSKCFKSIYSNKHVAQLFYILNQLFVCPSVNTHYISRLKAAEV
jgi:hypothetical protein